MAEEGRRFFCTAHPACRQVREQKALRERRRGERVGANTDVGRPTLFCLGKRAESGDAVKGTWHVSKL
jgi:hypothetical protein